MIPKIPTYKELENKLKDLEKDNETMLKLAVVVSFFIIALQYGGSI